MIDNRPINTCQCLLQRGTQITYLKCLMYSCNSGTWVISPVLWAVDPSKDTWRSLRAASISSWSPPPPTPAEDIASLWADESISSIPPDWTWHSDWSCMENMRLKGDSHARIYSVKVYTSIPWHIHNSNCQLFTLQFGVVPLNNISSMRGQPKRYDNIRHCSEQGAGRLSLGTDSYTVKKKAGHKLDILHLL